jgi:hypothetical protein
MRGYDVPVRVVAFILWGMLAVVSATGCIPVFTPLVLQDITTGEKLRSIDWTKREWGPRPGAVAPEASVRTAARCDELRARLMSRPPVMEATVHAPERTTPEGYGVLNPGMFNPVDRERADLRRARDAGLLTAKECAELEELLEAQADRSPVRRAFETAEVGVAGSMRFWILGSGYSPWSKRNPMATFDEWTRGQFAQADSFERVMAHGPTPAHREYLERCTRDLREPSVPPNRFVGDPPVFRVEARGTVAP